MKRKTMKIYVKNMVCPRCITAVREVFLSHSIIPESIVLGEILLEETLNDQQLQAITRDLQHLGFDVLENKNAQIIERAKNLIIELVQEKNDDIKQNLSEYLKEQTGHEYSVISSLFSEKEGTTIEKFYIAQKIERVKELLIYNELSLKEIAFQLHYSSVAHLSNQFKKVTGLTTSHFKEIGQRKRKPLDGV